MSAYRPTIETLDDWNEAIGSCECCLMPECPVPTRECESISGYITSQGHRDPADTVWKRYKKQGTQYTLLNSGTVFADGIPRVPPAETPSILVRSWNSYGSEFVGTYFEHLYTGGIGVGVDCPSWPNTSEFLCEASGESTVSYFEEKVWSPDGTEFNYVHGKSSEIVTTISPAAGLETVEYTAWVAIYTDADGWQVAHDAWQDSVDAYTTWETNRDNWLAEDPDRNTEDFPDVEPPLPGDEPEAQPEQFYGDCCWKITDETTIFAHSFGYKSDDGTSPADPPDNEVVQAWLDAGGGGTGPSTPGTGSLVYYVCSPSSPLSSLYNEGGITEEEGYFEPQTYAAWLAEVSALLDAEMPGVDAACKGVLCVSDYQATEPEEVTDVAILSKTSSRFRWVIPVVGTKNDPDAELPDPPDPLPEGQTEEQWEDAWWADHQVDVRWEGSYFKITWDVVFFPVGHDAMIDDPDYEPPEEEPEGGWPPVPQIPDPDAPDPVVISTDQTWTWAGPGDPDDLATWKSGWYDLPVPTAPGENRVVNIRFECYRSPQFGNKPQVTGEAYEIPSP
jgi:hypothetical protein